jgi:tetratricopeptide (TPR) repeat protein
MTGKRPAEAVPFLERARRLAPGDPVVAFQLGLAHLAQEQYDRAQPLLEEAFRAQPTLDGLGYYTGFLRYRGKDYRGALDAFRGGRAADPELQQLTRFYSGLALGILGLPAQAAAEIEQAIRAVPASPLTGPAERLRDTMMAARERDRRFTLDVRFGFFHDDNVPVVPDSDSGEPLVATLRSRRRDSTGELLGVRLEYAWLRTEQWEATAGYSFFGTYNNDLPSFNIANHLVTTGVTRRTAVAGMPLVVGAQYSFDALFLDDDEFLYRHTASLFATLVESERHLSQVVGRYQNKDFATGSPPPPRDENRDADSWLVGVTHFFRFAQDRHFVKLGYQFDHDATEGRNYRYLGHRLLAGAQYTLPWYGIRLRYDVDLHLRDYVHRNTLLPSTAPNSRRRDDEELTNVVRVEVPLPLSLTLGAEYQSTINRSNVAVFDYTRNVFSLILQWSY